MSNLAVKERETLLLKEKVTLDDIVKLYGHDMMEFIVYCVDNKYLDTFVGIYSPQEYKQFVELYLEYVIRFEGFERYEEIIEIYNKDIESRFLYTRQPYKIYNSRYSLFTRSKNPYLTTDCKIRSKKFEGVKKESDGGVRFEREQYLENAILQYLPLPDLDYQLERQKKMPFGAVDLLITSSTGRSLVELKKENIKRKDVYQIFDYWASEDEKQRKNTEKILLGKDASTDVLELCSLLDVQYYRCEPTLTINNESIILQIEKLSKGKSGHFDSIIEHIDNEYGGCLIVPHPSFTDRIDKVIKKSTNKIKSSQNGHDVAMEIIKAEHREGKFFCRK